MHTHAHADLLTSAVVLTALHTFVFVFFVPLDRMKFFPFEQKVQKCWQSCVFAFAQ